MEHFFSITAVAHDIGHSKPMRFIKPVTIATIINEGTRCSNGIKIRLVWTVGDWSIDLTPDRLRFASQLHRMAEDPRFDDGKAVEGICLHHIISTLLNGVLLWFLVLG